MQDPGTLELAQTVDSDGAVRLSLLGELDHPSSHLLLRRLDEFKVSRDPVRLDLSQLEFIDSSGVRAVLLSVRDARSAGWRLEVDPQLSWQVQHVFEVLGLDALLWPREDSAN